MPSGQAQAQAASTTVEYMSRLQILSKADKIRLSGIICTIGKNMKNMYKIGEVSIYGLNIATSKRINYAFLFND